jgi:dihydrofolate synthase/folylpolyglutamate synthase
VKLPGRFQRIGNVILDVAHNPDGIRSVRKTLDAIDHDQPVTAILGVLGDKDWREMLIELSHIAERIILVSPPTAPASRAWNPAEAARFAAEHGIDANVQPFERAITDAHRLPGIVLITGSFHTVGDALPILGENTL